MALLEIELGYPMPLFPPSPPKKNNKNKCFKQIQKLLTHYGATIFK